jgi:apolipoprotein N-acyltransferase
MISNTENNNSVRTRHEGLWCGSSRSSGIFWGILLVAIGLIWIGKKMGFIPYDMALFWPSVMVIMGIWLMATAMMRRRRSS